MKINRERPPHIAVADPYYMRDSQLQDGSRTRTKAVRYLQNFMLMYKESNTILLPVFPEDKYCTLIILDPKWSLAQYFDSSSTTTKKDYKRIRGVLDEAILGYSKNGGTFHKNGQHIRPDTKKPGFKHVIDFPCVKQPAGSIKEAFYVLHHLKGFVEDAEMMSLPPKMTYYVVFEGRVPGVYEEWEECKKQVHKFSGNCYKGYPTRHEAVAKWRAHQANKSKMKTFLVLSLLLTIVAAVFPVPASVEDSSGALSEDDRIQRMKDRITQLEKDLRSTYALAAIIKKKSEIAADVERYALTELHKATESLNSSLLSIANATGDLETLYPKVLLPANMIVDKLEKDSKAPEEKDTPQG
ncbi:hypothetical protein QYE76_060863 [Lolium multiflorum]|uniref:Ribonuclease H n=1 Tax=Lolium multiflorum TaxID=4521 RepID=A0AAD8S184_LOLMU|nr:hypothetical protein QYE76_060863 [Lolium multiflorum]